MALKYTKNYRADLNHWKLKPPEDASQCRRPQFDGTYGKHASKISEANKEKYDSQAEEANLQAESVSVRGMNELQTKSIRTLESAVCTCA